MRALPGFQKKAFRLSETSVFSETFSVFPGFVYGPAYFDFLWWHQLHPKQTIVKPAEKMKTAPCAEQTNLNSLWDVLIILNLPCL